MNANMVIKDVLDKEYLHDKEVHSLKVLHGGELAAVEAYDIALNKVKDEESQHALQKCRDSHALRSRLLGYRLDCLNAHSEEGSGFWGTVTRAATSTAGLFGPRVLVSLLSAGEDYGFEQYDRHMKDLDSDSFELAETGLLPAQGESLHLMTNLCKQLRAA